MSSRPDDLAVLFAAMNTYNCAQRAELEAEAGLTYLGDEGPAFLAGKVRMRGLFRDTNGNHWTDANLVVESAYLDHPAYDYYADKPGRDMDPGHDLWVCTPERGWFNAIVVPLVEICAQLDLPDPESFPGDNWVRSWQTHAESTDASEIGLVAHGLPRY